MMPSPAYLTALAGTDPARLALYCERDGFWTDYGTLAREVETASQTFRRPCRQLAFLLFSNTRSDVAAYLGLLDAGHVPALIDPHLDDELLERLIAVYRPSFLLGSRAVRANESWRPLQGAPTLCWSAQGGGEDGNIHPDLGLLLTTSGSTGSPKMARLSTAALAHNCGAIIDALRIGPDECACLHLPLHYSYGLSVLHTHLAAGASVVLTERTMIEAEFWDLAREQGCTSLPGTPHHYRMLDRLGLDALDTPSIRVLTQAGGRLDPVVAARMHALMSGRGGRFYVMYGQTEAAPRITTLDHDAFAAHPGSVGRPLAGGRIDILGMDGGLLPTGETGQVVYRGPNVMMGYAESLDDLALGDAMGGVLPTGDLGHLDADGFLYLTGRANRFAKISGFRINLDEVETLVGPNRRVAAIEKAGIIQLFAEGLTGDEGRDLRRTLTRKLRLPSSAVTVTVLDVLPVKESGKTDYARLKEQA